MLKLKIYLTGMFLLIFTPAVQAIPYYGIPVTGIGSNTQAVPTCPSLEGDSCYNPSNGETFFYIPLGQDYSGIYGVTPVAGGTAGTISDVGSGYSDSLTMYLLFEPVDLLANQAQLDLYFTDLDLIGGNDPNGFTETVRFYRSDGTPITDQISTLGQPNSGSDLLAYNVSGNYTSQSIHFPDISPIAGGNYVQNPFYLELTFGSKYKYTGQNTIESLSAQLVAVPEPTTSLLMGLGLTMLVFFKKGFRFAPISSGKNGRNLPLS